MSGNNRYLVACSFAACTFYPDPTHPIHQLANQQKRAAHDFTHELLTTRWKLTISGDGCKRQMGWCWKILSPAAGVTGQPPVRADGLPLSGWKIFCVFAQCRQGGRSPDGY